MVSMRNTKSELLAHIAGLEARLHQGGLDMAQLRLRISILEGAAALKATPQAPANNIVTRGGVQYRVEVTKRGASTTKRYIPLTEDERFERDSALADEARAQQEALTPEFPRGEFPF